MMGDRVINALPPTLPSFVSSESFGHFIFFILFMAPNHLNSVYVEVFVNDVSQFTLGLLFVLGHYKANKTLHEQ